MPRRKQPPRLYLDPGRDQWIIRDGATFIRTGLAAGDHAGAERQLARYLASKHAPPKTDDPLIVDVLNVYAKEHLVHTATAGNASYSLERLARWWGHTRVSEIGANSCRQYAAAQSGDSTARRDLEVLRAAIRGNAGPAGRNALVVLPRKPEPRTRWLTRSEAARLLWAARRVEHLRRFILLGLYTGSRSKNLFGLRWEQVDLAAGVMHRRGFGQREDAKKRAPPVRLGRRILLHLRRWRLSDGKMPARVGPLIHFNGKPIKKFSMTWGKAIKAAGLDWKVTPHTLRRTRATWLMQNGVQIWESAGHLGMSPDTLTRIYAQHHPDFQKNAAEV